MSILKAIVCGKRAIIENVGDYPDGAELDVEIVNSDQMSREERARLNASLDRGLAQMKAGDTISAEELIESLHARRR